MAIVGVMGLKFKMFNSLLVKPKSLCVCTVQCLRLSVSEREMEKEHQVQLARWRAAKEAKKKPADSGGGKKSSKKSNRNKSSSSDS